MRKVTLLEIKRKIKIRDLFKSKAKREKEAQERKEKYQALCEQAKRCFSCPNCCEKCAFHIMQGVEDGKLKR